MRALALALAGIWALGFAGATAPARSAGEIVVASTSGRLLLIDAAGHRRATLAAKAGASDRAPEWSPDGTRLVFTRTTDGWRSARIYVVRADGGGVRRLTGGRFDDDPAWSPDGRWIAYVSSSGLRLVRPDGTGDHGVPGTGRASATCTDVYATTPAWTPDGRLAYAFHAEIPADWPPACRKAGARCGWVWTVRPDGGDPRPLVHGRDAHWSPDGATVVYTPPDGGVATVSARGGGSRLLGRGYLARWSGDGSRIVYARLGQASAGDSIWIMGRDGAGAHRILAGATHPAWRPGT